MYININEFWFWDFMEKFNYFTLHWFDQANNGFVLFLHSARMTILFNNIIWTFWWSMDSILSSKLLMQPAFCISQHQRKGRQVLFRNDRVSLQKHLVFVIHNILHRNIFFWDINLLGRFSFLYKNRKSLMLRLSKTCLDVILLAKLR